MGGLGGGKEIGDGEIPDRKLGKFDSAISDWTKNRQNQKNDNEEAHDCDGDISDSRPFHTDSTHRQNVSKSFIPVKL